MRLSKLMYEINGMLEGDKPDRLSAFPWYNGTLLDGGRWYIIVDADKAKRWFGENGWLYTLNTPGTWLSAIEAVLDMIMAKRVPDGYTKDDQPEMSVL